MRGLIEHGIHHLALVTKNHILSAVRTPVGASAPLPVISHGSAPPHWLTGAHKCPIEKKTPQLLLHQHLPQPSAHPAWQAHQACPARQGCHRSRPGGARAIAEQM